MIKRILSFSSWLFHEAILPYNPARVYNSLMRNNQYEYAINYAARVDSFTRLIKKLRLKPARMLDIATGTGAFIDALHNKHTARILGIDISPAMLNSARSRFKHYKNIRFKQADFAKIKLPNNKYDLIAITYATRFIPQHYETLFAKKVARALTKNGIFIAALNSTPLERLWIRLSRTFGFPRGYNLAMNFSGYFARKMSPYLTLKSKHELKDKYPFLKNIALVFKKK